MESDMPVRRYDTDPEYRARIQEMARSEINYQTKHINRYRDDNYGAHPMNDGADIAALAVVSSLGGRRGVNLEFEADIDEEVADVTAEIIRQATFGPIPQQVYEEAAKTVTYAPRGTENELTKKLEQFVDGLPVGAYDMAKEAVLDIFERLRDGTVTVEDGLIEARSATSDARVELLTQEATSYSNIAEKWSMVPGLTLQEACHGVAHDAYALRFNPEVPRVQPQGDFNPSRVYGSIYDMTLAEEIQARKIRAAKDLFG